MKSNLSTIEQSLRWANEKLTSCLISDDGHYNSAHIDSKLLLCDTLGCELVYLHTWPEKVLSREQSLQFKELVNKRALGLPVAYIIGYRDFWSLRLNVSDATLIPRAETELLVETAIDLPIPKDISVLDLGTGTGAIALALASEKPAWRITGVDRSLDAIKLAQRNALENELEGVEFIQSDWFTNVQGHVYDLIVSNPPYVEQDSQYLLQGDVRFEPLSALTSGLDGLDDIRFIVKSSAGYLSKNGWLMIEHGYQQEHAVLEIFHANGFEHIRCILDLNAKPRVTIGRITAGYQG